MNRVSVGTYVDLDAGIIGASQDEVQPWHRLGGVEHICELRKSPQVLYGIFVTILRMIYRGKKGRTFGCPDVVWSRDPQKTQLWIDTELRWEDTRPSFTPAIFVHLGELSYEPLVPGLDMQGRVSISHDGERGYERTVKGTASIVHVCDRAGAACSLADNTEIYLSSLQDQIAEEYCFGHLRVSGRVPRQKKEIPETDGKGKYVSTVTLAFDFYDSWSVKIESPILKKVSMVDAAAPESEPEVGALFSSPEMFVIDFGDVSTETDTPLDK